MSYANRTIPIQACVLTGKRRLIASMKTGLMVMMSKVFSKKTKRLQTIVTSSMNKHYYVCIYYYVCILLLCLYTQLSTWT